MDEIISFAHLAHGSQMRRGSEEPYVMHPLRVYESMMKDGYTGESLVVALLHDVVEDTSYCFEDCNVFLQSEEAREALVLVTKLKGESSQDALHRILLSNNRIALAVKAYDSLDNSKFSKIGAKFTEEVLGLDFVQESDKYLAKAKLCFVTLANLK